MDLVLDYTSKRNLNKIIWDVERNKTPKVRKVYAAIAYNQDDSLIKSCINNNIPMDWWCLFNSELSTNINLLVEALKNPNIKVYPIAEYYHPKLIYFEGYGLYIGSANMTYKALKHNVEAGVFIQEEELKPKDLDEFYNFFEYLKNNSINLTRADIKKLKKFNDFKKEKEVKLSPLKKEINDKFNEEFSQFNSLIPGSTQKDNSKSNNELIKRNNFYKEWRMVQNELEYISNKLEKCKIPEWVSKDAPMSIITDRFLHAYYESYVLKNEIFNSSNIDFKKGTEKINYFYSINKNNKDKALNDAISWWENYDTPINDEDIYTNVWAIENKQILSKLKDNKYELTINDLYKVFLQNHASSTHARQIDNSYFGLAEGEKKSIEERVGLYVKKIITMKTASGLDISDVIRYLLFDEKDLVEKKVYNILNESKYQLEHFGKSSIGELACWGRPDTCFLRNNRVNKALRCLGFDVELY